MRFVYLLVLDPAAGEEQTWRAAVFASQPANAVFARTSKSEDTVRYQLGDREYELPVLGPFHHATRSTDSPRPLAPGRTRGRP